MRPWSFRVGVCITRVNRRIAASLQWFAACALCVFASQAVCFAQPVCDSVQAVRQASRSVAVQGGVAVEETVGLPDTLLRQWLRDQIQIAYTLTLPVCPSAADALFVYRAGAPYKVTTESGVPLVSTDSMEGGAQAQYNGRVPQLFSVPAGTRRVRVMFQTKPHLFLGLLDVEVGPMALLAPRHAQALAYVMGWGQLMSGVLLVVGAFGLFLWGHRRAQHSLLWLSIACGLWGLRGVVYFQSTLTLPARWFELFNPLAVLLTAIAIAMACNLMVGKPARLMGWLFGGMAVLATALMLTAGLGGPGMALSIGGDLLVAYAVIFWVLWWVWTRRLALGAQTATALAVGLVAILASGAHDGLMLYQHVPSTQPYLLFWGFVVLLLVFAALSSSYMMRNLRRAEQANEELERAITSRTAELDKSYVLLGASARDAARTHEREHLLREMHDGIGAQLMAALRGVERGALNREQLASALQDGLDEIRLLMDSTDTQQYLPGALAAWRNRWDARLAAAGVTLAWTIDGSLDNVQLGSDAALQITRILQEAATNVVKHSQAAHMSFSAALQGTAEVCIDIADNGVGPGAGPVRAGARGLKNMQYRAVQIGAELQVLPQDLPATGCRVSLRLPLPSPLDDAQTAADRKI